MNNRKHLALMCATMLGLTGVIASQNVLADNAKDSKTQTTQQEKKSDDKRHHHEHKHEHKHDHKHHHGHEHKPHDGKWHQMSEQQKAEFEKRRAQFYEQATKACNGKLGQSVEFKIDQQSYKGTCELGFKPTKFEPPKDKAGELAAPPKADFKPEDGKKFKFGREQRNAMDTQVQQACNGKVGKTVTITLDNNVKVDGTCEIRFKQDKPNFEQKSDKK